MDSPETQTTVNKTELPKWVDEAGQENLKIANELADRPYVGYGGSLTAGPSTLQKSSWTAAANNGKTWRPAVNGAQATLKDGMSYQPDTFLQGDVAAYMNPFTQQVEDRAIANAGTAFKQNLNAIGDSAQGAGAFGGSRHGISEGVAAAENARGIGDLSAQLRERAYTDAAGRLEGDITRGMQGQQMRMDAANQYGSMGLAAGEMGQKDATLQAALGETQRGIEQQRLQEKYAKWKEKQDYPLQALNLRLAALGATPYGGTQTQTSTATGGGNMGMTMAGGIMSMLPLMFGLSDKDDKEDIEKIGRDPATGEMLYAYRYKGDPKSYPKVVGPMAQDIEKIDPSRVREIGGHKIVANLGFGGGL